MALQICGMDHVLLFALFAPLTLVMIIAAMAYMRTRWKKFRNELLRKGKGQANEARTEH